MSSVLRKAFVDICNGYSSALYDGREIFVKHLNHRDHLNVEEKQAEYEADAKKSGLPTEAQKLESLKKNGMWSESKELNIERQKSAVARFEDAKKKAILPSVVKQYDGQIAIETRKLNKLLDERESIIGLTVEKHAQKLTNDYYIIENLYLDKELSKKFLSADNFDYLLDSDVSKIVEAYNLAILPCSEANIKKLSIQDFFQSYFFLCSDNLHSFYGKPIVDLTFYQIKLGNYAKYFKGIFENHDMSKLPKDVKEDPDKIEQYILTSKESNKAIEQSKGDNTSLVGATQEDLKALGLDKQVVKFPNKAMNKDELINFLSKGGKQ